MLSTPETATLYRCKSGRLASMPCTVLAPYGSDLPNKPCACKPETWQRFEDEDDAGNACSGADYHLPSCGGTCG